MNTVCQALLDYLDPKSLSIFYELLPEFRTDIRQILASPKHMIIPISLKDPIVTPIIIRDMSITISFDGKITIATQDNTCKIIANIDHEKKEIYFVECMLNKHNLHGLLSIINLLKTHILEVCSEMYQIVEKNTFLLSTPSIQRMKLSPTTRIAIPLNVMEQFKVNDISGLMTFQDKFVIF